MLSLDHRENFELSSGETSNPEMKYTNSSALPRSVAQSPRERIFDGIMIAVEWSSDRRFSLRGIFALGPEGIESNDRGSDRCPTKIRFTEVVSVFCEKPTLVSIGVSRAGRQNKLGNKPA